MPAPSDLLAAHGRLSSELARSIEERGDVQALIANSRATVVMDQMSGGMNITTAREYADASVATLQAEVWKLTAKVDAARARLAHVDMQLSWWDVSSG